MKARLRHPISAIREPFGTAGLVVAVIALVLALTGAAFAAAGLSGKQKKEVEKIAKKFAGKPGPAGPQGAAGAAGAAGKGGTEGPAGANGKNGTNGRSVEVGAATSGPSGECEEGGATVQVQGEPSTRKAVCDGSPWTAGGTLPKGATETGTWGFTQLKAASEVNLHVTKETVEGKEVVTEVTPEAIQAISAHDVPISFTIPLDAASVADFATLAIQKEEFGAGAGEACENLVEPVLAGCEKEKEEVHQACPATVDTPEASPGSLCVYEGRVVVGNPTLNSIFHDTPSGRVEGGGTSGAILLEFCNAICVDSGTWAVKAG